MRQGGAPPTGKWIGNPHGGVKAPEALILPDPTTRFATTASSARGVVGRPSDGGLAALYGRPRTRPACRGDDAAVYSRVQSRRRSSELSPRACRPLAADGHRRDAGWRDGLALLLDVLACGGLPEPRSGVDRRACAAAMAMTSRTWPMDFLQRHVNAGDVGRGTLSSRPRLQVYFTRIAAGLDAPTLRLLPERGLCPCCGSTPVAGLVTASGQTPGTRYLYCSLCSTAWNHVRAVCITCEDSRTLSLKGIEGDSGAVKAETCDDVPHLRKDALPGQRYEGRSFRGRSRDARA